MIVMKPLSIYGYFGLFERAVETAYVRTSGAAHQDIDGHGTVDLAIAASPHPFAQELPAASILSAIFTFDGRCHIGHRFELAVLFLLKI